LQLELQEQADRALRHFAGEGDMKWISLMMWYFVYQHLVLVFPG
jgi:hypothetical protein